MTMTISDSTGRPAASRRDVLPDGPGVAVTTSPVLALAATTEPAQVTTRSNTKGTRAIGHGYQKDGTQIYYRQMPQKEPT
jgi:hypothetical protein